MIAKCPYCCREFEACLIPNQDPDDLGTVYLPQIPCPDHQDLDLKNQWRKIHEKY